ncbi:MAG: peptide chain release factor 2 [Clostridia bacterium]|nr:peptide chain release factor 2 [Clostridia bacterium]
MGCDIMDFDSIRLSLEELKIKLDTLKDAIRVEEKREQLKELEKETLKEGFWNDNEASSKILTEMKNLKSDITKYENVAKEYEDAVTYLELAQEENDSESFKEARNLTTSLSSNLDKLEVSTLLSDEYDRSNSIITIHPGAGGTESQDWALMLYRMYTRWAQRMDFTIEVLDYQDGEEAGVKSVSFLIKGENAYGYTKGEAGVHRLVRISPFDANSRRHTSFAALEVLPEISDEIVVDIKPEDIEMDVFRASGAGGQHVNKTSSAVRLRHIPTGIVVSCQTERSQMQNREYAMKMLKAKIYKLEKENHEKKINNIKGETTDNAWGNQIRSYVFCPYTLVKDHRTGYETGNVQAVMDGKIDDFIYEYLKSYVKNGIMK